MLRRFYIHGLVLGMFACGARAEESSGEPSIPPNVIIIYTDDVGFGDISCQGAKGVETPNIDRIAREGLSFSNGHCAASTCTPSRYSLLTGEYAFRNPKAQILRGDAPALITPERFTLAHVMKEAGYATAVVGKWHLGLGDGDLDWNGEIAPGPLEIGFDTSFIIPATGDRTPCVYVEDHHVVNHDPSDPIEVSYENPLHDYPIGRENPELLKQRYSLGHDQSVINGVSRIGYMSGGRRATWKDEDMADVLTDVACSFIQSHADSPFFLYYSTHDIHVPRVPHERFRGRSSMGLRGDAIVQLDESIGRLLKQLDALSLTRNTLVVFTSDNGAVLDDGYHDEAVTRVGDHDPSGPYRGGKASRYEGGTRVPFLIRWPERVSANQSSSALVCQMDFVASLAALLSVNIPEGQCLDSENHLSAFVGEDSVGRSRFIASGPGGLSIIDGKWKYVEPGRITDRITAPYEWSLIEEPGELYDLGKDASESFDRSDEEPEVVNRLRAILELERDRRRGVSRD